MHEKDSDFSPSILLSAYACQPLTGSEPGIGWNWFTSLLARGVDVQVVTCVQHRPGIEMFLSEHAPDNLSRVHFVDLPSFLSRIRHMSVIHYLLWQVCVYFYIKSIMNTKKLDIIHHVSYGSIQGGSLLPLLKIPFIFGPLGGGQVTPSFAEAYFGDMWHREKMRTKLTRYLPFSFFHAYILKISKLIFAVNDDTAQLAKKMGGKDVQIMLDTAYDDDIISGYPKSNFSGNMLNIIWVGRLLPRKAVKLALEAVQRLSIPFKLTIIGHGPQYDSLRGWVAEMNLESKVHIAGQIAWSDVLNEYDKADLLLFTSLRDTFGSQIIEAASRALPIITLDLHGSRLVAESGGGIKAKVGNRQETIQNIADAIQSFYFLSIDEKLKMSSNALRFAKDNSLTARTERILRLYKDLLR